MGFCEAFDVMQSLLVFIQFTVPALCVPAPDGSLRVGGVLHSDPITGLIRPGTHAHMLLGSGHSMAVPPDFFLHPQT